MDKSVDKYINTIIDMSIEINIEHNYSKYHRKNSIKIARLSQDFNSEKGKKSA